MERSKLDRLIEIIQPSLVLSFIGFLFIGSVFIPVAVAYFLLAFNVYWLFQSATFTIHLLKSLIKLRESKFTNWNLRNYALIDKQKVIEDLQTRLYETRLLQFEGSLKQILSYPRFILFKKQVIKVLHKELIFIHKLTQSHTMIGINIESIKHVFVVAEYKEPVGTLLRTLNFIHNSDYPIENVYIVIGQEERDPTAISRREELKAQTTDMKFGAIWYSSHPASLPGEIIGKASNENWGARYANEKAIEMNWDPRRVIIHTLDADICFDKNYLSQLTFKYSIDPLAYRRIYTAGVVYYNNINKLPVPNRLINSLNSLWNIKTLSDGYALIPVSTYALSLDMAREVDFWDPNITPEDHHMFYKCFYKFGDQVVTTPIFTLTSVDAAEDTTIRKTMFNQYKQFQRWAWGVSDIVYVTKKTFTTKEVSLFSRIERFVHFFKTHFLWSTTWFAITLGSSIPIFLNPKFKQTVLGENLQVISSSMFTVTLFAFLVAIITDIFLRPRSGSKFDTLFIRFCLSVEWFCLPVLTLLYSSLPSLDAHMKLLFGKYLEYYTTVKVDPEKKK